MTFSSDTRSIRSRCFGTVCKTHDEERAVLAFAFGPGSRAGQGSAEFCRGGCAEESRAGCRRENRGSDRDGTGVARGSIDDPDHFTLRAELAEFYLGRADIGQAAQFEKDGQRFAATISKIYPQVNSGQFEIDLSFTGTEPRGIRRGQTLQGKLTLGDSTSALLLPNGAFYQDTGGNWVFVVNAEGGEAVKRNVKLGRRNSRYIEVLDGLEPGEEVVTSPYSSFKEMDRLQLTDD